MAGIVKYPILVGSLLVIAFSAAQVLAPDLGRLMAQGCMQMMRGMQPGSSQRPNEQWRGQR